MVTFYHLELHFITQSFIFLQYFTGSAFIHILKLVQLENLTATLYKHRKLLLLTLFSGLALEPGLLGFFF